MGTFYETGMRFNRDNDNQAFLDKMKRFESEFQKVKDVIPEILRLKEDCENYKNANSIHSFNNYIETLANNQLITLRAIYCCRWECRNLPIDNEEKRNHFIKECVLTMESLNNFYDKEIDRKECSAFFIKSLRCLNDSFLLALDVLK